MSHVPPRVLVSTLILNDVEYSVLWKVLSPVVCEATVYLVADIGQTGGEPLYYKDMTNLLGELTRNMTEAAAALTMRVHIDGNTDLRASNIGDIDELFDLIEAVQTAALAHLDAKPLQ